jgi:hypothetical protein
MQISHLVSVRRWQYLFDAAFKGFIKSYYALGLGFLMGIFSQIGFLELLL